MKYHIAKYGIIDKLVILKTSLFYYMHKLKNVTSVDKYVYVCYV